MYGVPEEETHHAQKVWQITVLAATNAILSGNHNGFYYQVATNNGFNNRKQLQLYISYSRQINKV